jgi:hypothetical protein
MFPNPDNGPTFRPQTFSRGAIAFHISFDLCQPIFPIARRHSAMLCASVPKTTVHENRYPLFREHKVRATQNSRVPSPTCEPGGTKERD